MNVDLVFEGGGILGISYIGALKAIEEKGYTIQRCAGTSAGSIVAALIMAGYTSKELTDILYKNNYSEKIKSKGFYKPSIIGKTISLIRDKGVIKYEIIESIISELLEKKRKTRFMDVMVNGKSKLKIIAADITRRKMIILPDDLHEYGVDPFEFSIAKAVAMSCAIPMVFTPIKLKYNKTTSYIVDGGLLSNFPIWIFDVEETPRWPTFGIKIKDPYSNLYKGKTNIISYIKDVIQAPLNQDGENFIRNKDYVRTAIIDNGTSIKSTDFGKFNKNRQFLFQNGYNCTNEFLKQWDFKKYVQKYRCNYNIEILHQENYLNKIQY